MTSNPMITREDLRKIHLYCYEDVQEFLAIHKLLDEEIEKPDNEMDKDLIEECLKYVEVVMGEDGDIDEAMLEAKYQEVMAKAPQMQVSVPTKIIRGKKRSVRKFFCILAAAITILFTALTITAKIYGYNNAWEFVYQKAIEIMELDAGKKIEDDNITIISDEKKEEFASVEEFLSKENLNILYPQSLPDTLKIKTIYKITTSEDHHIYIIHFNKESVSILIRDNYAVNLNEFDNSTTFICNEKTFYVKQHTDSHYEALCHANGFEYDVNCENYETLVAILQNMKGK